MLFRSIDLANNLAYIDPVRCKSCRKCVEVCPQNTITELNFPPRKPKTEEAPAKPVAAKETVVKEAPAKEAPVNVAPATENAPVEKAPAKEAPSTDATKATE